MATNDVSDAVTSGWVVRKRREVSSAIALAAASFLAIGSGASYEQACVLIVFAAMMIGWVGLRLPQTPVALAGAVVLILLGAVEDDDLFEAFGGDIVWIMLAAFLVSAVLSATGLAERLALAALSRTRSVAGLFWSSTAVISASAFAVPSTSARAAMLLPVFAALASALPRPAVVRGLGLLFPSIILLSAAATLTGAGAHIVAADFIDRATDLEIGYGKWLLFGLPVAILTCVVCCALILHVFLDADDRAALVHMPIRASSIRGREKIVLSVACLVVLLFASEGLHGLSPAVVGLSGALVLCSRSVSGVGFGAALKKVDWDLLLFLAATLCIGEALLDTGAAEHLVGIGVSGARGIVDGQTWPIVAFAATASALAHLLIISRTARATVLIPTLALPLAGMGGEPHILIMTVAIGSGFCQTFAISAKPVMIFAAGDTPPFDERDLVRLAIWLLPPFVLILTLVASLVWPAIPLPV